MEQKKREELELLHELENDYGVLCDIRNQRSRLASDIEELEEKIKGNNEQETQEADKVAELKEMHAKAVSESDVNIEKCREAYQNMQVICDERRKEWYSANRNYKDAKKCFIILLISAIAAFVLSFGALQNELIVATIVLIIAAIICKLISNKKKPETERLLKLLDEANEELQEAEDIYNFEQDGENISILLQRYNNALKTHESNNDIRQRTNNGYQKKIEEKKLPLEIKEAEFKKQHDIMVNKYSVLLNERDWYNIARIIFYYETGRADNIRDALLHIDVDKRSEAQNSRIQRVEFELSSIGSRISSITGKLDFGFRQMTHSIGNLSSQLSDMAEETEMQRLFMNEQMRQMTRLATEQQEALDKMGSANADMAKKVDNMNDLAERTYREQHYGT